MDEHSKIEIHRSVSGYVFRIVGRGTLLESAAVCDFVCGAIEDGADVVLDLSECEYLDSTFLGGLVIMYRRGESGCGSFAVFADESARRNLLDSCRLDLILPFVDECPPCTESSVALQVTHLKRTEFAQHLLETHRKLAKLGGPAAETFRRIVDQLRKELDMDSA
jgi:anti-anti-sigma regulatory factor